MTWLRERIREPLFALRAVFHNADLRRVQLAWAGSIVGQYAYSVALAVYAYRHGGATAVGLVTVVRLVPAAVVAPFAAVAADRYSRSAVMLLSDVARAGALAGGAAVIALDGPAALVYAVAAVVTTVGTIFRPAEAALLPSLARTPEELTAANVSSSTIESVGIFVGPALGGALVALASVEAVFAAGAAALVWSALLVARLPRVRPEREAGVEDEDAPGFARTVTAGFRAVAAEPALRVIVGLYSAQTTVAGAVGVLLVACALSLLDLGEAGVGYLNAALGVGGILGAAVTLALVGRRRLASDFAVGLLLWGLPLLAIGLWPSKPVGLVMFAVLGLGNTLVDVSAMTLLQRTVADEVLARVFGVLQTLFVVSMALGALVAPALVSAFGIRAALVATGALLPALTALLARRLVAIDRRAQVPARQLALLRAIPIFAPLPPATLEHLAHALREEHVPAGTEVVREGEQGDRFFVLVEGEAEVDAGGRRSRLDGGDYFGEIALLRDVPRTATVRAVTELTLYSLDRDEFVAAVTGHAASRGAADAVVRERLGATRAGLVTV